VSQTATVVKIERTTSDDLWTLIQTITQVASTSSAKVAMTLKNNSSEAKEAHIVRYAYATPDDVLFANYDGTQNSAFTWNSIGSGTHPFGLVLQNVGTSPFFGYNGFAQNTAAPPNPCDYTANWTGRAGDKYQWIVGDGLRGDGACARVENLHHELQGPVGNSRALWPTRRYGCL
jgi:hypothetical protein